MPKWLVTTARLLAVIGVVAIASVAGLIAFRNIVDLDSISESGDSIGSYLQVLGGIYAVLLAFVVIVVWGQFNDARGFVHREANALTDLYRTASGLPPEARDTIQQGLRDYVAAVIADEWQAMTCGDHETIDRVSRRLDRVWSAIHTCMPLNECQHTVYAEVLARFNDLSETRTNRLSAATAKIPTAMNVLLYIGAFIMIGSMYLMPFQKFWLHATVTAALAGAVAHILFLIYDLDTAFAGDYQVDKGPFERARQTFERNR
ncbi:MAG TPA: DUF4239 domain-containing protein [Kofleriaceae bacterium]|nr:DUF4239 domain-containing protein [Kofleriaceae bacterium]